MPAFFPRSFSFASSDAAGPSRSSSLFSLVSVAAPTSWFARIVAGLRPSKRATRTRKGQPPAGPRGTHDEPNMFLAEPRCVGVGYSCAGDSSPRRPSAATTSSTLSTPPLSRSHSANSDTTCASGGVLFPPRYVPARRVPHPPFYGPIRTDPRRAPSTSLMPTT